jgi:hypothetical protein
MDLFVTEATSMPLPEPFLLRASMLRAKMQRLRAQIQRDGFLLEQLSLKTKTPYVQFTLTKRLTPGAHDAQAADAQRNHVFAHEGGVTESPPAGADSDDAAGTSVGGATGGGVTSALAAACKEPMSRPPM